MLDLTPSRIVDLVETCYAPFDAEAWRVEILRDLRAVVGKSLTVASFEFASTDTDAGIRFDRITAPRVLGDALVMEEAVRQHLALPEPVVLSLFRRSGAYTTSAQTGLDAKVATWPVWRKLWSEPVVDALGLVVRDPSGAGACVCVGLNETTTMTRRQRPLLNKLAFHMAAGLRLRAKAPTPEHADAVLTPSGRVLHVEDRIGDRSASLSEGFERRKEARRAKHDAEKALEIWRGLVDGRWSLVDFLDTDGKRLVLAMKNAPRVKASADLTARERQVAALVAMGHRDKEVSYMLGISLGSMTATLQRVRHKLGVKTRVELATKLSAMDLT